MTDARAMLSLVLGVIMTGLGLFVAGRLLWTGGDSLSPSPLLDGLFAVFFLARGLMHLWSVQRSRRWPGSPP
jgi:hypothetical protein